MTNPIQVRVARPTLNLDAAVSFYRGLLELPVLATFEDHGGYSGVVFGLPDASKQLEIVSHEGDQPSPTPEDQLVFYLGSVELVESAAARLRSGGFEPTLAPNPYWARTGAVCFVDPDGYRVLLSTEAWSGVAPDGLAARLDRHQVDDEDERGEQYA